MVHVVRMALSSAADGLYVSLSLSLDAQLTTAVKPFVAAADVLGVVCGTVKNVAEISEAVAAAQSATAVADAHVCTFSLQPLPITPSSSTTTTSTTALQSSINSNSNNNSNSSWNSLDCVLHYCGCPYVAACANFWVNCISTDPPTAAPSLQLS